jgi:ketosteroid isomerase-like protein
VSAENVSVVRAIYERWNGNESTSDLVAEDLEYINPPYAIETGVRRGRHSLRLVREAYPEFHLEPERFIDAGEEIVVPASITGRSVSGVEVNTRQTYVWTVRGGVAVRFRWFNELDEALAAVGLSADGPAAT